MDADEDIIPLLNTLNESLAAFEANVLPLVSSLDEDTLATEYSVEEQAKLQIVCAYVALMGTFSQRLVAGEPIDEELRRRVEKVGEYIGKIKSSSDALGSTAQRKTAKTSVRENLDRLLVNAKSVNDRVIARSK
eukprot:GDKJ01015676.1.p1 GENE.GDKJ01015676.1~~GDKJ01015676.1.p1  ORF type:complete len:134 (-),score=11.22 GDKJ01015676.1:103-504(-)